MLCIHYSVHSLFSYNETGYIIEYNKLETLLAYKAKKKEKIDSPQHISKLRELECRVGGIGGNTALVVLAPGHEDVATHAPVGTPTETENQESGSVGCKLVYTRAPKN